MEVVLFVVVGGAVGLLALIAGTRSRAMKRSYHAHTDGHSYLWIDSGSSSSDCAGSDGGGGGCDGGGGD